MAANIEQQWASASLSNDLATTPTTSTAIPGEEDRGLANKIMALESAKQSKLQILNTKPQDVVKSFSAEQDDFTAGIGSKSIQDINWDSSTDLQSNLGAIVNYQLHTDEETGQKYQLDKDGNRHDYFGRGRNLYIADARDGDSKKIGLAASGKGYEDRYTPDWKQYVPFMRGYGWKPGDKGVDPTKHDLDIELPYEMATAFEKYVHSNAGQLAERTVGQGPISAENALAYGSGKSEYTKSTAPMWNMDYDVSKAVVQADTPLPGHTTEKKRTSYLGNLVDAAQASGGRLAVSTVDTAVDAVVRGAKEIAQSTKGITEEQANAELSKKFGDKVFNDKGDWVYLDKYKEGKEYGYDDTNLKLFGKEFKGVMSDPNSTIVDKAAVALKATMYAPEVLASSAADIAAAVHPVGMVAFGANLMNEVLADRQEIKGTSDLDSSDYGIALATSTVATLANTATKGMAGIGGVTSKVIKDGIRQMDQGAFTKLVKAVGSGTLEEAAEESVQELAQIVGTKLGTSKQGEILSQETALDVGLSAALGGGAGGFTSAVRELTSVAGEYGSDKIQEIKESKPKTTSGTTLDTYANGVADGKTDIDLTEFVSFVKANKDTVDHDKVQEIIQAYGANLEAAQSKVFKPDGTVDGDVIRANPPVVDELFKYIADIENDDDAVRMMDTLVADFDDKVEMKEQLLSIRSQNREAKNSLAEFMGVQKDIFESGFLNHESMTEALTSGNIQDKQSFLNYETAKVQKLQNTVEDVKDNLLKLVGEDASGIEALAYLEARNFGGNAQMTRSYETGVIANAARLMGVTTTGDAFADGKAARAAYKDSQLAKDVKKASRVIKDFTDARVSGNDGKFEVKSHEVLGELANSMTKSNNYRTDDGYSKVLDALTTETELINKFINLDRSSMKARVELLNMYNGLKSVSSENKQAVKDEVGITEEKEEVTEDPTLKDFQLINTKNPDLNKGFYESYDSDVIYNSINEVVRKISIGEPTTNSDRVIQNKFNDIIENELEKLDKAEKEKNKEDTSTDTKEEKVETYTEEYMAEANKNAKPKEDKKGDDTKAKELAGMNDEVVDDKKLLPKQAREAERKLAEEINVKGEEYKGQKQWLDTSYAILRDMYAEVNELRNAFKPLLNEKYSEKRELEAELSKAYKLVGETKKVIKDEEAELKTASMYKNKLSRKNAPKTFNVTKSVIAELLSKLLESINTIKDKLKFLELNLKAHKIRVGSIEQRLKDLKKEIRDIEKKDNVLKAKAKEVESDIVEQKKSIDETTGIVETSKDELKILNKKRESVRNAYKADEKSASAKRLASTGFKGWSKPAALNEDVKLASPLNEVLEVSNGIAPLGVVDYNDLLATDEKINQYDTLVTKLVKYITQDNTTGVLGSTTFGNMLNYNEMSNLNSNIVAFNSPALSLLLLEPSKSSKKSELTFDKNALIALEVVMNEWLANDAINMNELTAKDVAKYYGMDEFDVSDAQLKEFQEFGIPLRFMAEGIGSKVLGHLGYKVTDKDVAEKKEISTRLKESLGMYVIKLAEAKNLIKVQEKTFNEIATIMGRDLDETVISESGQKQGDVITVPSVVFSETAKADGEKWFDIRKQDFGIVEQYNDVKFKRPSVSNIKAEIKRNKVTVAPTRLLEAKKDAMLREWHLKGIDGESVISELFDMDRDDIKTAMGYKHKAEIKALPVTMQKAAASKNRQIATSVDSLFNLADALKSGYEMNSLWFNYFIGKNNRLYLDSEGVNNQSDKFHRHLIFTEGQRATVIKGDKSERVFKLAVAQAFGLDVDKMPIEETMKKAEMLLGSQKEIEAGWDLVKKGAREFSIPGFKKPIKVKELGHLVDGIQAVRDYNEADGDFSTTLLVESDAVTSGFGLKLMQLIGNLEDGFGGELTAKDWLEKVGIFVGKDGKLLGGGIKDSYKTLAGDMTTENIASSVSSALRDKRSKAKLMSDLGLVEDNPTKIQDRAKEVTDLVVGVIGKLTDDNGEVTDVARKLFKPPFMTFMYGAGFTKIKKELAALVIDLIMEKVAEYDQDAPNEELNKLMMDVTGLNARDAYKVFMGKDIKEHKIGDDKRTVYEKLEGNINASFGNTVEVTMKKEFGTIIETNNAVMSLTNAVFGVWNRKFKEKVEDLKGSKLTLDSVDEITDSLVNDFPIIKGPLSEGISDGIAIFKTEIANNLKEMFVNKYSNAGGYFNVEGKLTTKGVNHVIRIYKEASAAAGVIPIHTLDGATMVSTVLGQDVQQVFDAIVGGIDNIEGRVTDYNRNVFELSMNWNFLEEVLVLADRVLGNEDNAEYLSEHIAEQVAQDEKFDLGALAIKLHEKSIANRKFKEAFKEQNGTIEHMVFNENTSYKFEKNSKITPESILGKLSTATRNKVNEKIKESKLDGDSLKDLFDNCK